MVAGIAHAMLGSGGLYSDGKKSSQAQNHANACWMGGLVVASLWQAVAAVISSPTAPSESWHVRLLLVLIVGCAFALCAQVCARTSVMRPYAPPPHTSSREPHALAPFFPPSLC